MNYFDNLLEYCCNKKDVYIYGAGHFGRIIGGYLIENNVLVSGYLVSSLPIEKKPITVLGVPVFSATDLLPLIKDNDACLIVSMDEKLWRSIQSILLSYGVEADCYVDSEMIREISSRLRFKTTYYTNNNINVLIYHRVGDYENNYRGLVIREELFEQQILYLKNHYRILRSEDDWTNVEDRSVVLTFDDGYCDFFENVVPLLEKHKVPGTVFVSTGGIDTTNEFWGDTLERIIRGSKRTNGFEFSGIEYQLKTDTDRRESFFALRRRLKGMDMIARNESIKYLTEKLCPVGSGEGKKNRTMTSEEIRKCAESAYVTIGAHTVSHCCLSRERLELQRYEMETSKKELERIIGKEVSVFAYPYGDKGDFNESTIQIAKEIGFKRVFAAYQGLANNRIDFGMIPRNDISKVHDVEASIRLLRLIELQFADPVV